MIEKDIDMTKNKLNILFLLEKIKEPVLELIITKAIIENELMDYFSLKTYLNELEEEGFIRSLYIVDKNHYEIAERGRETLNYFENLMMGSEKDILLKYVMDNIQDINKSKEMMLDYKKLASSQYQVDINLLEEDSSYFRLTVQVPSKDSVDKILNNWSEQSSDLYVEIMNLILKNKEILK